ncbi:MAG: polysaccharide biosynthesis tyrosine autokinase [Armatimonadota bacterium]|nr:polysaccharide biosynthesis tyrosine autokinase [Armatimonadota bacterium]
MSFWEIYRVLRKRKWMIVWLIGVTTAVILIATAGRRDAYVATSKIMPSDAALYRPILPDTRMDGETDASARTASRDQLPNLMSLIKSRTVAEKAVRTMGADIPPDEFKDRISVETEPNPAATSRNDRTTDIVRISVYDSSPEIAVKGANAVAAVFADYYQEISHQEAAANAQFLETQLDGARQKLDETSDALAAFKAGYGITSLPEETTAAVTQLGEAKAARDAALAAYAEAQAKLSRVNQQLRTVSPNRVTVEGTTNTPMVQILENQVASLTSQLNEARAKYQDEHPTVKVLDDALSQAQSRLRVERNKVRLNRNVAANPAYETLLQQKITLQSEADGLAARVAQLSAAVGRTSSTLKPGADIRLARLQQEFVDAQAQYSSVTTRLNEARINERVTTQTGAIRVTEPASQVYKVGRNQAFYLLLGVILSFVAGTAIALAMESLDNRIRTDVDLEKMLSLPVTGLVPKLAGQPMPALQKITYLDPLSPLSEAYKFIRTDLLLTASEEPVNVLMVATAKPGQGGTTTAANLAISLALDGKRVVLVDADMRRPQLHSIFKIVNDSGLSNVLSGERDADEALVATEIPNLLLMPGGPTPINPSELLGSKRMSQMIETLRREADFVLFDTPSAVAFTDSVVLSRFVDGVLLVVRANQVPRGAELQVKNLLNKANARIIGVVLNDVEPEKVDSYYYHSHYYPKIKPAALALTGRAGGGLPELDEGSEDERKSA